MEREEIKRIIEAVLFVYHEPLVIDRLRELFQDVDPRMIRELVYELKTEYETQNRSFIIREIAGGFQMVSDPRHSLWIKKIFKTGQTDRLTLPSLETLAIVAYKQPIMRLEIEEIRGVNVENILKNLLELNLLRVAGRKPGLGRPILYGTTKKFLDYFGLNSIEELPRLEDFMGKIDVNQEVLSEKRSEDGTISAEKTD
ncbi:MAG: SMC-Scp complex subunit ScpB [Candidatus Omnitrophica bacterium]|nr:SMC-Scp complex subunit ScpB [Candidatus Omnitrophota bacterium]